MSVWEILSIKRAEKTGEVAAVLVYDWLAPMDERHARKMAWSCDVWSHLHTEIRIRPIGDTSIGLPHDWLSHAPPEFFKVRA